MCIGVCALRECVCMSSRLLDLLHVRGGTKGSTLVRVGFNFVFTTFPLPWAPVSLVKVVQSTVPLNWIWKVALPSSHYVHMILLHNFHFTLCVVWMVCNKFWSVLSPAYKWSRLFCILSIKLQRYFIVHTENRNG